MKSVTSSPWSFAILIMFSSSAGQAATQNWMDAGISNAWSTGAANWDAGNLWTNGNDAVFGGSGETLDVDGTVTFRNLTFQNGGYVIADATSNGTLSLSANGTIHTTTGTTTILENIGGAFTLTKSGDGTLVISGANTYSGSTSITGGKLTLDFNQSLVSLNLFNTGSLVLGGGNLELKGATLGANSQAFTTTTFSAGTASKATLTSNGALTLGLNFGSMTRSAQSTVDFTNPTGMTTSTGSASSMLRASSGAAYATVNAGSDWAAKGALLNSANIVTFSSVGSYTNSTGGGFTNNANIDIASGVDTTVSTNTSVTTLRFNVNQARNVTINTGNILTVTGGILVTNASDAAGGTHFNGGSLRAGSTASELVIHQYGAGTLTIGSAIVDSTGGASSLTLAGTGITQLTGANTFTGATSVQGGTLELAAGAGFGSAATVNRGASVAGDGAFGAQVVVAGTLAPGTSGGGSTGVLTFSNGLSLAASGTLAWQLNANAETAGGGISDYVQVGGGSFALATGAALDLMFGGTVDFTQTFWDNAREWTVVDLNGAIDATGGRTLSLGTINGGLGNLQLEGAFTTLNRSGDQVLAWSPLVAVPEPSVMAFGLLGLSGILLRRR